MVELAAKQRKKMLLIVLLDLAIRIVTAVIFLLSVTVVKMARLFLVLMGNCALTELYLEVETYIYSHRPYDEIQFGYSILIYFLWLSMFFITECTTDNDCNNGFLCRSGSCSKLLSFPSFQLPD